eukprot:2521550-Amphidinium_carterae.1
MRGVAGTAFNKKADIKQVSRYTLRGVHLSPKMYLQDTLEETPVGAKGPGREATRTSKFMLCHAVSHNGPKYCKSQGQDP